MNLSVTSNSPQYRDALIDFIANFRLTIREAIRYEGRLLGERLIQFTPPRTQAQGRKRVDRDIRKVILGLDNMAAFDEVRAVVEGDESIVRAFVRKDGTVYGVDRDLYRPNATFEDLNRFHQAHRLPSGRVTDAGTQTRDIGRWKFLTKLVVLKDTLEDYIMSVQARVGRGKGGWAKGVLQLGGKVAQWIGVHARTSGEFQDGTEQSDPFVLFINKSEWASGGDQDRIMDNAIESRIRDIRNRIIRARKEASKSLL